MGTLNRVLANHGGYVAMCEYLKGCQKEQEKHVRAHRCVIIRYFGETEIV